MAAFDLGSLDWELCGWQPNWWKFFRGWGKAFTNLAVTKPMKARVPGSVQQTLLDAGLIEDPLMGVNARKCEWVEHRDWVYHVSIPADAVPPGQYTILEALGLDHAGSIYLDGEEIGQFRGTHTPHRFDLSASFVERKTHELFIVFEPPPHQDPIIGYTSRTSEFKPRFNYCWDWVPRLVSIGIWDALSLRTGLDAVLSVRDLHATVQEDRGLGRIDLTLHHHPVPSVRPAASYEARLTDGGTTIAKTSAAGAKGPVRLSLKDLRVELWWPNGAGPNPCGPPKVYTLEVVAKDSAQNDVWRTEAVVGFKRIEWRRCEGASDEAEPWICVVNGEPIFLQGINWTPVRALFADTRREEYEQLVGLYRAMGCNCMRVWGGGLLEREPLYDACDRAGILTWQDFPLSSAGIDNFPPTDERVISELENIAEDYLRSHAYHVSRLLYCGGNELREENEDDTPVGYGHPLISMLKDCVERFDPERRFIASTALGPTFSAKPENFGKGIHHNVHGPHGLPLVGSVDKWMDYWTKEDSMFRAEVGMPGAEDAAVIRRYAGGLPYWPPTEDYWQHSCSWWIDWRRHAPDFEHLGADEGLEAYVRRTQHEQADLLTHAVTCCKGRFPSCGGFILWHGHDCFPCPINNTVIDIEKNLKPAYFALQKVFWASPEALSEQKARGGRESEGE